MDAAQKIDRLHERILEAQEALRLASPNHPMLRMVEVRDGEGIFWKRRFERDYCRDGWLEGLNKYIADLGRAAGRGKEHSIQAEATA